MDIAKLTAIASELETQVALLKAELIPQLSVRVVRAGENLQTALAEGVPLELEAGAQFTGSFVLPTGAAITGRPGSALRGETGQAIVITPGATDVSVTDVEATSKHPEVILVGENTAAQTNVDQVPRRIAFTRVVVPSHRGKRAFALHGSNISLIDCQALDVWDAGGQDSQAIYIGNAPGQITVRGGRYSAGSEIVLLGGDATKIPNLTPEDILFDGVELFRPLSWQTDGIKRKVKNIFEDKNGRFVTLRNSRLSGCWRDGQNGEAIVLTPALDGAQVASPLRSGEVQDVTIEDVTITDCASVANIVGRNYAAYTVNRTSGIVFRRVIANCRKALSGLSHAGIFALIQGEPDDVLIEDCEFTGDGKDTINYSPGTCLDPVTHVSRTAGKLNALAVMGSKMTMGEYGFMLGGSANAVNWQASVASLVATGNTFSGASSVLKAQLPNNTYL